MKKLFVSAIIASAFAFSAFAEVSTTISDVHICCQSCVKGVEKAVKGIDGLTATVDQDAETVKLTGPEPASTPPFKELGVIPLRVGTGFRTISGNPLLVFPDWRTEIV